MDIDSLFNNLTDLHTHLGSSSTPEFLWEMAHEQGIKLPEKDYFKFIESVVISEKTSYNKYLDYFHLSELIQSSLVAVEKAVHNAISLSYRKSKITTIEIRFNPMLRNRDDEQDLDKIILGAVIGMKKAVLEYPVKAGLILMMDRRFDKKKNNVIAEKAIKFKNDGILGIDVGGPLSDDFKVTDIAPAFEKAHKVGLKSTFHTGEVTDTKEMWEVINLIKPNRIGHGIRCVDDKKLMDVIRERNIVLELCPTSNIKTGAVKNWLEFGNVIEKLKENKIKFTINSDGPVFLKTNVELEFRKLYEIGILSIEDIEECKKNAKEASFITG